jgi:hypothetical protein
MLTVFNARDVTNVWRRSVVLIFKPKPLRLVLRVRRLYNKPSFRCEGQERRCVSMQGQLYHTSHLQLASHLFEEKVKR